MSKYSDSLVVSITFFFLLFSFVLTTSSQAQLGDDEPNLNLVYAIVPEAPGANCPNGGNIIASGFDDNRNGRLNFNEVDNIEYACNGEAGATGPEGPQGPQGPDGPQGVPGPQGSPGAQGPQGPDGDQGQPGTAGVAGDTGPTGPEGPQGETGADGPQGEQGLVGDAGISCWDLNGNGSGDPVEDISGDGNYDALDCLGPQGPDGPAGIAGITGSPGPKGPPGPDGPAGSEGPQGTPGSQGAKGPTGPAGANGGNAIIEPAGVASCSGGAFGTTFNYGADLDGDESLSQSEQQGSFDICDGVDGTIGTQGPAGPAGANGSPGVWRGIQGLTCANNDICIHRTYCNFDEKVVAGMCGDGGSEFELFVTYSGVDTLSNNARAWRCIVESESLFSDFTYNVGAYCIKNPNRNSRIVFQTELETSGNIVAAAQNIGCSAQNGIAAADCICQTEADEAGLVGIFKAWLSDDTSDPASTFIQSTNVYEMLDHENIASASITVANNWNDLTDGNIDNPINRNADGLSVSGGMWTNTNTDGTLLSSAEDCQNWTSSNEFILSSIGAQTTGSTWTARASNRRCDRLNKLYCFEQ